MASGHDSSDHDYRGVITIGFLYVGPTACMSLLKTSYFLYIYFSCFNELYRLFLSDRTYLDCHHGHHWV